MSGQPDDPSAPAEVALPRPRRRQTVADMVRSLGLVGLFVLALWLVVAWQRPTPDPVRTVDVAAVAGSAAVGAPFPLLVPAALPSQWRPTSAYFDPPTGTLVTGYGVWHVGLVTPSGSYAELDQTGAPASLAVARLAEGSRPVGRLAAGGRQWQRYDGGAQRALLAHGDGWVAVVTGKAGWPELEMLAGSLAAVRPTSQTAAPPSG